MGKVGKAEYVQRASKPTGMPSRSPTHDASVLRCMMHFPSPPTHKDVGTYPCPLSQSPRKLQKNLPHATLV